MQRRRRTSTLRADLALAGAAFFFGSTFLVVQDAITAPGVSVPAFLGARFACAVIVLLPLALRAGRPARGLVPAGVAAGAALSAGYLFQTAGLDHTTTSVSAFVTYLLVVFVPLLSAVVLRKPPARATMAGVALAVVGLALLLAGAGAGGAVGLGRGELLTLGCAVAFAAHIIILSASVGRFDLLWLNVVQCAVVAVVAGGPGFFTGGYDFPAEVWWAAAYTGVAVTALAFGLQLYGQKRVSASRTALMLMMEPVFAAVLGFGAGERLGVLGALGAVVILSGIVVSELGGAAEEEAVGDQVSA